jgi:transglutaminase-like putative cysteine protease
VRYVGSLGLDNRPTFAVLRDLPPGFETRETLRMMRDLVHASLTNPAQIVREQAISIVHGAGVDERDWAGEVSALQTWVRDNIRFQRDPEDFELVQTPEKTLEYGAGDCDDKATLLAALLKAQGHPAQFIAIGFDGETYSHVLVRTKIGEVWTPAETILSNVSVGWWPDGVTSHYILKV